MKKNNKQFSFVQEQNRSSWERDNHKEVMEIKAPVDRMIYKSKEEILDPLIKSYNEFQTNEELYTKDDFIVYTSYPELFIKDSMHASERDIEIQIIKTRTSTKTISNKQACFMPGCPGTIYKHGENWYGRCKILACKAIAFFFQPEALQESFINNDSDTIMVNLGGFGSGKTTASAAKVFRHMLNIPHARVLAFAQTLDQLFNVGKSELDKFIPPELIAKTKNNLITLTNGSKILFIASDLEDKIRGYNLTMAWVIEFNKVKLGIPRQLEQRIRSANADYYDLNEDGTIKMELDKNGTPRVKVLRRYHQLILESNPDPSSTPIQYYFQRATKFISTSNVVDPRTYKYALTKREVGKAKIAIYSSTILDNPYISEEQSLNMQALNSREYEVLVRANLAIKDGLVYPKAKKAIVPRFKIPDNWPRVYTLDFGGGHAPTVMSSFALDIRDPKNIKAYLYDVYKKIDASLTVHIPELYTRIYGSIRNRKPFWPVYAILGDPSGVRKTEGADESPFEKLRAHGIIVSKADNKKKNKVTGEKIIELGGIDVTNDVFEKGQLMIFSDLDEAIYELENLKYEIIEKSLGEESFIKDKKETGSRDDVADTIRYFAKWLDKFITDGNAQPIITQFQKETINLENQMVRNGNQVFIQVPNAEITTLEELNGIQSKRVVITRR